MITCVVSLLLIEAMVLIPSYRSYLKQLKQDVANSAETVFDNIQFGINFTNFNAMDASLFEQILDDPGVVGFSFFDQSGDLLHTVGEAMPVSAENKNQLIACCDDDRIGSVFGDQQSYFFSSLMLNRMDVTAGLIMDSSEVATKSRSYLFRVLGLVALICLAVTGSVVLVMGRYATRIEYEANYDKLTQLPNRQGLLRVLDATVGDEAPYHLVHLDIDGFKAIKDRWGEKNSETLIVQLVERLQNAIDTEWCFARLLDDRFALLIRGTNSHDLVLKRMQSLQQTISTPIEVERDKVSMTACVGIYASRGVYLESDAALERADIALAHAKEEGGNRVIGYEESLRAEHDERISIITRLRSALADTELSLNYQPQYSAKSGQLVGAETLMRWYSSEIGNIPPSVFIPLAEQTGIIIDYGAWAMKQAVRQYARWREAGLVLPVISVNVSPKQFGDEELVSTVASLVEEFSLQPGVLELEITESAVIQSPEVARSKMEQLAELGVDFAIDDFGTGHSSSSNLGSFPFSRLKVDQSFIRQIVHSRSDRCIVKSCIELAHVLGMTVVAEGVERSEEFELLAEWGCDIIQGYYFSKPLTVEAMQPLLIAGGGCVLPGGNNSDKCA